MLNNVVVIGGSNIDICAKSDSSLVLKDSNIGHVEFGLGGVGRNVAEELCLFGAEVSLLTAVGNDSFGRVAIDRADEVGLKLLVPPFEDAKTGVYAYVSGSDGSFVVGVNDMLITEKITPEVIEENINAILFSDLVVIETNLNQNTIEKIASCNCKLIADAVSGVKCGRLANVLDKLFLLKCNRQEAFELSGTDNCRDAVRNLVNKGLERGIITLGSEGAMCFELCGDKIHCYSLKNLPDIEIADSNGCGDAFLAGFIFAVMRNHGMQKCLVYGQSAAYLNSQSLSSVNRKMNFSMLKEAVAEFNSKLSVSCEVIEK